MLDFINIHIDTGFYYLVSFLIALVLLSVMRHLAGVVASVSASHELAHNTGVSLAGAMVAVSIMLMGAVSGEASASLVHEALLVTLFGVIGIVLMWLTRIAFDRISFPHLSLHNEIIKGNMSASIIDACNMIATAIIIKGAMTWVWVSEGLAFAIIAVIVSFIASQVILALATLYRVKLFEKRHADGSPMDGSKQRQLHSAIEENNIALALRFSAYRIGVALAVSAAFAVVAYDTENIVTVFLIWFAVALVFFILLTLVAAIIRYAVLYGINVADEVGNKGNVAIGVIEGSIYIVVGLLLVGLIGA